ncbi:MAG: sodium/calcium exchanger protein [Pseudomonadales bacterium]|nr:sodium/calcium exchanger protein [Pseudomonadales bacterium]
MSAPQEAALNVVPIDPERHGVSSLGKALGELQEKSVPKEFKRAAVAAVTWLLLQAFKVSGTDIDPWVSAFIDLAVGLIIIQVACQSIIAATERVAARFQWDHYVAATWSEILASLPEIVVVAFLVPVNPYLAFIVVMLTIYNNALVFSCYSFFLPKDYQGKFLMPKPITEAGTQILVAGGAIGLVIASMMVGLKVTDAKVAGFANIDLLFIAVVLIVLFAIYLYRLTRFYAKEEKEVREALAGNSLKFNLDILEIYQAVKKRSWGMIIGLILIGSVGSLIGGACVHDFAEIMTGQLNIDPFVTAFLLAAFGGMGEYVTLWNAHRHKEYGIALANAFGGMTQVLFLILPITLFLGAVASIVNDSEVSWLVFNTPTIMLFAFMFPTFYTLTALLEEDHTFDLLDTAVLASIVVILIYLLLSYGNGHS